jgi:hypothetical protein
MQIVVQQIETTIEFQAYSLLIILIIHFRAP